MIKKQSDIKDQKEEDYTKELDLAVSQKVPMTTDDKPIDKLSNTYSNLFKDFQAKVFARYKMMETEYQKDYERNYILN